MLWLYVAGRFSFWSSELELAIASFQEGQANAGGAQARVRTTAISSNRSQFMQVLD